MGKSFDYTDYFGAYIFTGKFPSNASVHQSSSALELSFLTDCVVFCSKLHARLCRCRRTVVSGGETLR